MIRYICDRCKKEIEPHNAFVIHIDPPEMMFWGEDFGDLGRHICRDCMKIIFNVMEGKDGNN